MSLVVAVPDLKAIISTDLSDAQLTLFIGDAVLWVNEELTPGGKLSLERREVIARYLAASLVRLRDVGLKSVKMDDVSEAYQVDPEVTDYLLRAAAMDPTGRVREHFLAPGERTNAAYRVGGLF